jgi:pimeloyl-ACP methyl ester carboxylesterase
MPLQGLKRTRDSAGQTQLPILLVHGYLLTSGSWWALRRWLVQRGHSVYVLDLDLFCAIDRYAGVLRDRIDAICAATGARRVLLVGHSMGGLAVRAYLRAHGTDRVGGVVTLGSPHHGSVLARFAIGENGRAMRPGSAWLECLAQDERAGWQVPVVSIYSCHDNLVAPQASSRLEHAVNVPVAAVGHLTLPFSRRVREAVAEAIDRASK